MSSTPRPTCALNVSALTLSDYRDAALGSVERERIARHLPTCARCRQRLEGYERGAAALRAERVPIPDERLWRGVYATMGQRSRSSHRASFPSRRVIGGLCAVAAVVLLVVGFARLLNRAPAGKVLVGTPLDWTRANFTAQSVGAFSTLAPVGDGTTAYACTPTQPNGLPPAMYVTNDRGATWTMIATLPVGPENICAMVGDQTEPTRALVLVWNSATSEAPITSPDAVYATQDGGQKWTRITTLPANQGVVSVATQRGITYLLATMPGGASDALYTSTDAMKTWKQDAQDVGAFWLEPDGTLYYTTEATGETGQGGASVTTLTLHASTDGGKTATTVVGPHPQQFIVRTAASATSQPLICAASDSSGSQIDDVSCSSDGGQTWIPRNTPPLPSASAGQSQQASLPPPEVFAVDSDGSLLGASASYGGDGFVQFALYRLAPGGTEWESIGTMPSGTTFQLFAGTGVPSVLWAVPARMSAPFSAHYTPAATP